MVEPIRSRSTFDQLRRSRSRGRSGPLTVSYLPEPGSERLQVGYSIGRRVGNAAARNRLRRRLRALVRDAVAVLPRGAYMVGSGPEGTGLDYDELKVAMSQAVEKATGGPPGDRPERQPRSSGR